MKYRRNQVKQEVQNPKSKMGGHAERMQPNVFYPNGLLLEEATSVTRPLDAGRWAKAEERTAELISHIQPNWPSEKHRNAVASYVRRLISNCVPCQVFTFGSVPLKTYLPDGDIDLTAFSEDQNVKDNWAKEVRDMLQREEKNEHAEFPVKEVQYIQAEVKLIKCLVDNIVVDISFNQLGGLCTLCFLEEVDNLINQDHLFKRSIILIKAWCYYESRILGAHHGLISTYALETLVLYIFHVFNNSFAGPLEVLYRFLEFFSKFDWANFCVSLWGPVPISSLPSMAANPPRRDGGELLLNKMFLNACGTAYSVIRGGHENQEQPFISKHFNVIDPLRLNNNLGRSVSKGNFYRIRSAFSFGAEQLARVLKCQEEDIVAELNQFFVNTWDRHGKGCRPDAPILDVSHLRQVESAHDGKLRSCKVTEKPTENFASHASEVGQFHRFQDSPTKPDYFPLNQIAGTTVHASKQKDYEESTSQMASNCDSYHSERMKLRKKQQNVIERTCRMNILQNREPTSQFARTSSSPELTSMSTKAASIRRDNVAGERVEDDADSRLIIMRRMRGSEVMENHVVNCLTGEPPIRESSSRHSLASNTGDTSGIHVNKAVGNSMKLVFSSGDETSQRQPQEEDITNLMSSPGIQKYGGHVQMPVNLPSYPFGPIPSSNRVYSPQNYAGTIPVNLSAADSDWSTSMHYSDGSFLPPFRPKFSSVRVTPERQEMIGGLNGRAVSSEADHLDEDSGFWTSCNAHSRREIDPESEDFSTASSRLSPASPATSSRTKASSESSWDGKPAQMKNSVRYPLGKKTSTARNSTSTNNSRWQEDGKPHDCDDDRRDMTPLSTSESGPSVTSSHVEHHQLPGFEQAHMNYQNSLPFGSLLVRPGSDQVVTQNHAVLPVALYPAGSFPYVTMVPVYNLPAETRTSGAPTSHNDLEMEKSTYPMNQSVHSSDTAKELEQLSHTDNYNSVMSIASEEQSECGSDIFNSDFVSHWQNLQYGRRCQNSQLRQPFFYPPNLLVPSPLPLQGHLPLDASQSPIPGSSNVFAHLVPVPAPQHGSEKTTGVSRQYGGEVSKQRNGTGTYFPNPEIIKGRQFSTSRQFRGDYSDDRNEHQGDRESNWNFNSKPRFSGRAQPRFHNEKPSAKIEWSPASGSLNDRPRDTFRHNSNQLYRLSKGPFPSKPTRNGPKDVDYSVYPMRPAHHDEVSPSGDALPPLVMLYPYPQNFAYGSWTEQLRFGSVGPEHFVGTGELSGYSKGGGQELQNYDGDTGPPTPDYASSPRFPRGGGVDLKA